MLGNIHDTQDATQAVFIVLTRKAGTLRREGNLGGWLHKVARNVALQALERRATSAKREKEVAMWQETVSDEAGLDSPADAALQFLDQELAGLSAVLRQAVVLRYLQGNSEKQAAELAACPQGTLSRRASDGIAKLRQRLAKRGVALGGAALVGLLTSEASAAVPETLLPSILATVKTAVATTVTATGTTSAAAMLAKGAMKAMLIAKVKMAAAVAAVSVGVLGVGGVVAVHAVAQQTAPQGKAMAEKIAAFVETTNTETTAVNGLKLSLLQVDARIEGSVGVARFVLRWENVSREPMAVFFSKRWFDDDSDDDTLRACVLKPGEISETPVRDATVSMHMSVPGLNEYGVQALFAQDTSGAQFSWKRKAIPDSKLATEETSSSRQFTATEREKLKNATLWIGKIRSNVIRLQETIVVRSETAPRAPVTTGDTNGFSITAKSSEVDNITHCAAFEGDVHVTATQFTLTADRVLVFRENTNQLRRIEAFGHVVFRQPDRQVICDKAVYEKAEARITLTGKAVLTRTTDVTRGEDSLTASELVLNLNDNHVTASGGAKVQVHP
jgi:lipopolysaccharide transport protein LptA